MEEKKNKNIVVIIVILLAIIVGIAGYITYEFVYKDKEQGQNKDIDNNKEAEKSFDMEYAKKLVENYYIGNYLIGFINPDSSYARKEALEKTKEVKTITCSDFIKVCKENGHGDICSCENTDKIKMFDYDEVNKSYQSLYSSKNIFTKDDDIDSCLNNYVYSKSDNTILEAPITIGCGDGYSRSFYKVLTATEKDDNLVVEVAYVNVLFDDNYTNAEVLVDNEKVEVNDNIADDISLQNEFIEKYKDKVTMTLNFIKEGNNYLLYSIK